MGGGCIGRHRLRRRGRCDSARRRRRIRRRAARDGAAQVVTTAMPGGTESNAWADPGERVSVPIGSGSGPRVDWQIGLLSEGRIHVLTASFTVARLAKTFGCFVTGTAHAAKRLR
jgi:hypothetical protein